ncbi:MAG: efflux transporter outer membrane subunit [Proteobacteria bacterium]|nr:efflux transporter outer membrane subunit [Pseudomonadota bacterium]
MKSSARLVCNLFACAALSACKTMVDADPHAPLPDALGGGAPIAAMGGGQVPTQILAVGEATPHQWWRRFDCADLDRLIELGLAGSNDIAAANAALKSAQAQAGVANAASAPGADFSYSAQRTRTAGSLAPPVTDSNQLLYSLHTAQITVNYPVDLFGGLRARRLSAAAAVQVAQAHLLAARQTLAAGLAEAAITRAQLIEQIAITRDSIGAANEALQLTRKRRDLGAMGDADVAAQEAALASLEGTLPALARAEAHQRAIIAALIGRAPGADVPPLPETACLSLPRNLPLALPADVVRNRPDVRAASAVVKGAAADVGVAVAARFPALTLSANVGGTAQNFSGMFQNANIFWSVLGGLTGPLFHAGALHHQQQSAQAILEQDKAQYRIVVLQAFVEVTDAVRGLQADADALEAAQRGLAASQRQFGYVVRQQQLGDVGTLVTLQAQQALLQARMQMTAARAARLADTVALYQANGEAGTDQGTDNEPK